MNNPVYWIEHPYCKRFVSLSLVGVEFEYSSIYLCRDRACSQASAATDRVDCLIVLAAYNVSHSTVQSRHPNTLTQRQRAGREGEAWSIYTFSFKACRSTGGVRFLVVALCFRRVVRTDAVNKQWREWSGGRLVSLPIVVACVAMTALCWNNRDYRLCHHDWTVSPMLCCTHLNYLVSSVVFAWLLSFINRLFHLRIRSFVWFENVSWLI